MSPFRLFVIAGLVLGALLVTAGCTTEQASPESSTTGGDIPSITATTPMGGMPSDAAAATGSWRKARLETDMGTIVVALDPGMPITAGNFETLVEGGFYDGVIFHRVMKGFMIQGGDPTGTGFGGPGYAIPDELRPGNRNDRATISMANAGPNTGGSQFFINLVDNNFLDTKHPVFGRVIEGMEVVDAIGDVPTSGQAGGFRPTRNVTILRAEMI